MYMNSSKRKNTTSPSHTIFAVFILGIAGLLLYVFMGNVNKQTKVTSQAFETSASSVCKEPAGWIGESKSDPNNPACITSFTFYCGSTLTDFGKTLSCTRVDDMVHRCEYGSAQCINMEEILVAACGCRSFDLPVTGVQRTLSITPTRSVIRITPGTVTHVLWPIVTPTP